MLPVYFSPQNIWKLCSSTSHISQVFFSSVFESLIFPFFVFHQYAREKKKTADASLLEEYSLTEIAQMLKDSSTPVNANLLTPSKCEISAWQLFCMCLRYARRGMLFSWTALPAIVVVSLEEMCVNLRVLVHFHFHLESVELLLDLLCEHWC